MRVILLSGFVIDKRIPGKPPPEPRSAMLLFGLIRLMIDEGNDYLDDSFFVTLKNLINRLELFVGACVNKNLWNQKNNIVLVGPVNSGKSSVFNRLVGFDRAIVSSTLLFGLLHQKALSLWRPLEKLLQS